MFLPGKSHGSQSLVGYCPWGRKESDTTERLHFHFILMGVIVKFWGGGDAGCKIFNKFTVQLQIVLNSQKETFRCCGKAYQNIMSTWKAVYSISLGSEGCGHLRS